MSQLTQYNGTANVASGVFTLSRDAGNVSEHHDGIVINVEGVTGDCTITVTPLGFSTARNPGADGENVIAQNTGIVLDYLGPVSEIVITPAVFDVSYKVSWAFF